MTLLKNKVTGVWEANIKDRKIPRLHVSLKTTRKAEAIPRHTAVEQLVRHGDETLINLLRRREINVEDVVRCAQPGHTFEELRKRDAALTLGRAVEQYIEDLTARDMAPNTIRAAKHYLKRAREFFGDNAQLDEIAMDGDGQLSASAYAKHLRQAELAPASVGLILQKLSALYAWVNTRETRSAQRAHRAPRLLFNPIDPEIVPGPADAKARFLSEEEIARLWAATPNAWLFAVGMGLLCGLRIDEVRTLRPPPQDLDLETGVVTIQAKGIGKESWRPKSKKRRSVPMNDEAMAVARTHLASFASDAWMLPSAYSDGSIPMSTDTMNREFERIVTRAGLIYGREHPMGVTFHTLRHTFASHLIMAGVDLYTVKELLGHSSIKTVQETYGHLSQDHKRMAVDQLEKRLAGAFLPGAEPDTRTTEPAPVGAVGEGSV